MSLSFFFFFFYLFSVFYLNFGFIAVISGNNKKNQDGGFKTAALNLNDVILRHQ